jgi:hypothetical protein
MEYTKNKNLEKQYSKMLELEYIINFSKNFEFEKENTIPISIKTSSYTGVRSNKRTHKLIKKT